MKYVHVEKNSVIFFYRSANRSSPLSLIIMSEEEKDKDSLLIQSKQGTAIT